MKQQLIFPMAFYVFYIWCLLIYMFITRANAIKKSQVSIGFFRTYSGEGLPDKAIVVGRHFDNQFQVPVLFLMAMTSHLAFGKANSLTVILAWAFIGSRLFHSYIHLGTNNVKYRAAAYAFGWFLVMSLWTQLVFLAI